MQKKRTGKWVKILSGVLLPAFLLGIIACDKEEDSEMSMECSITSPEDGHKVLQGESVVISADAEVVNGTLARVNFYVNSELILNDSVPPYQAVWEDTDTAAVGAYKMYAIAIDEEERFNSSSIIVYIDSEGGFNPDLQYGTLADVDGNTYRSIRIGDLEWMAENLRASHRADGSSIPLVSDSAEWAAMEADAQAYCWYNNADDMDGYGALYTWEAAVDVCPDGWHLPSDEDWKNLEISLGMEEAEAIRTEWRGSDTGNLLKEDGYSHWEYPNEGDNTSGFTALPAGFRSHKASFYGYYAYFWTSSEDAVADQAWYRSLLYDQGGVFRNKARKSNGLSVRCVKDLVRTGAD